MKLRKIEKIDLTVFTQGIHIMEEMKAHSIARCEIMFFDLMIKLFNDVKSAVDEGKPLIAHLMSFPVEIYTGMGVTGVEYDMCCGLLNAWSDYANEIYTAAAAIGVRPEICSPHRASVGFFAKGWFPKPDALIGGSLDQCDNMSHNANLCAELYDVPVFCVNRPYRWWSERGIEFMVDELKEAIAFLEEITGKKMDYDRLEEAVKLTLKQMEMSVEIHSLAMAKPCPVRAGSGFLIHWIRMAYGGTQEGVDYCATYLNELKERVAEGKGFGPKEEYRLINLFTSPAGQHEVLDWLEQEIGAVFVAEPMYFRYNEKELAKVDTSKPLEALARFFYLEPYYQYYGPYQEYEDMIINDALESGAEGAINWFNDNCRMCGAVSTAIKDALSEKVGIPTMTIGVDLVDNSPAVGALLKKQLEPFFLVLDNLKAVA
ncbi:MAG: 2-hydroxyacyl-CoA dehydratase [Deltaproteobacteria bacterium]|nr:2-hydroxyacyl-CoA dehydratase [Deltaproteobacteria bacterium]